MPDEKQTSQCDGKERFDSLEVARRVARRRRRTKDRAGGPYRCRFCKGIHIGRVFNRRFRTGRARRGDLEEGY